MDQAIARYNDLRLDLTFVRIASGAEITVSGYSGPAGVWGQSGFPSAAGNPFSSVLLNTNTLATQSTAFIASAIQHEIGHCIGLRHTDYFDRSYSGCFGNEGAGTDGAIHIPGTPTGGDPQSFMLACWGSGVVRSFVPNDVFALSYIYNLSTIPRAQLIHEFYKPSGDNAYTLNTNYQLFYSGWNYIGASFRAFMTQVSGTLPIYEYYNSSQSDHAYSFSNNDPNILGFPGWALVGLSFYVYQSNVSGSIPVYWYYNASQTRHVYTSDPNIAINFPGFTPAQVAWYALLP